MRSVLHTCKAGQSLINVLYCIVLVWRLMATRVSSEEGSRNTLSRFTGHGEATRMFRGALPAP